MKRNMHETSIRRSDRSPISLVTAMLFASLLVGLASAATALDLTVCAAGCDYSSITAAVAAAQTDDVIMIEPGTYTEGEIVIDKALKIMGTAPEEVVVDASSYPFAFKVTGSGVRIKRLTVANAATAYGLVGKGGIVNEGEMHLVNVRVLHNVGGGVLNKEGAVLTIKLGCLISGNVSNFWGGGITNRGELTIWNSLITSNVTTAAWGGGIHNDGGTAAVHTSVIALNQAPMGGGYYNDTNSTFVLTSSVLADNVATSQCPEYFDRDAAQPCG